MTIVDLKLVDLEQAIVDIQIDRKTIDRIKKDVTYYDEAYITESGHTIMVFQQEFVSDPYMDLPRMSQIRLVVSEKEAPMTDIEEVFDKDSIPIITRTEGTLFPEFRHIYNERGKESVLIPASINLSTHVYTKSDNPYVRQMEVTDLDMIEELFKEEYSLRY